MFNKIGSLYWTLHFTLCTTGSNLTRGVRAGLLYDTKQKETDASTNRTTASEFLTKADGRRSERQMENHLLAVYPLQ